MSQLVKQLNRIPKDRQMLLYFYAFFSAAWVALLIGYALGYWQMIVERGGHVGMMQWVFLTLALIIPLFVIWFPFYLTSGVRNTTTQTVSYEQKNGALLAPEQVREINLRLEALANQNSSVKAALGDILATTSALAERPVPKVLGSGVDLDAPNLPLTERLGEQDQLSLGDLAIALDFADQVEQGDWANAFEKVNAKGGYMELMRASEKVIDVLESDGVYVEDLAIDEIGDGPWRALGKGKRNAATLKLEFIKDRATDTLVRARLKNDKDFQEAALRFQKRFLEVLEQYAPTASEAEFAALAKSRAGRSFAVLGAISGLFKAQK